MLSHKPMPRSYGSRIRSGVQHRGEGGRERKKRRKKRKRRRRRRPEDIDLFPTPLLRRRRKT
jgi:hypothetical protein